MALKSGSFPEMVDIHLKRSQIAHHHAIKTHMFS